MKKVILYTFSGTGNTRYVAERIAGEFSRLGWEADNRNLEELLAAPAAPGALQADLIGFGCPVIGFGLPLAVRKALRRLPRANGTPAFVFRSAGGVAPINYRASKPLIRALRAKGYAVFHERLFAISSNWLRAFDPSAVARLLAATERKIALMCGELAAGKERFLKTGFWSGLGMEILIKLEAPLMRTFGSDFRVGPACTRCGLCVNGCPMGNIRPGTHKPRFGLDCSSCLRCIYACPRQAIGMKRFAAMPITGGYSFEATLAQARNAASRTEPAAGYVPPFLAGYEADDAI